MPTRRHPQRPHDMALRENAREAFPGGLGGKTGVPQPVGPRGALGMQKATESAQICFFNESFDVTSTTTQVTLTYVPLEYSEHVYVKSPDMLAAEYQRQEHWTRDLTERVISINSSMVLQTGDVLTVEYAYMCGMPAEVPCVPTFGDVYEITNREYENVLWGGVQTGQTYDWPKNFTSLSVGLQPVNATRAVACWVQADWTYPYEYNSPNPDRIVRQPPMIVAALLEISGTEVRVMHQITHRICNENERDNEWAYRDLGTNGGTSRLTMPNGDMIFHHTLYVGSTNAPYVTVDEGVAVGSYPTVAPTCCVRVSGDTISFIWAKKWGETATGYGGFGGWLMLDPATGSVIVTWEGRAGVRFDPNTGNWVDELVAAPTYSGISVLQRGNNFVLCQQPSGTETYLKGTISPFYVDPTVYSWGLFEGKEIKFDEDYQFWRVDPYDGTTLAPGWLEPEPFYNSPWDDYVTIFRLDLDANGDPYVVKHYPGDVMTWYSGVTPPEGLYYDNSWGWSGGWYGDLNRLPVIPLPNGKPALIDIGFVRYDHQYPLRTNGLQMAYGWNEPNLEHSYQMSKVDEWVTCPITGQWPHYFNLYTGTRYYGYDDLEAQYADAVAMENGKVLVVFNVGDGYNYTIEQEIGQMLMMATVYEPCSEVAAAPPEPEPRPPLVGFVGWTYSHDTATLPMQYHDFRTMLGQFYNGGASGTNFETGGYIGDRCIALIVGTGVISAPAGWSNVATGQVGELRWSVFDRAVTAAMNQDTDWVFTTNGAPTGWASTGYMWCIRGVTLGNLVVNSVHTENSGSATCAHPPAGTTMGWSSLIGYCADWRTTTTSQAGACFGSYFSNGGSEIDDGMIKQWSYYYPGLQPSVSCVTTVTADYGYTDLDWAALSFGFMV